MSSKTREPANFIDHTLLRPTATAKEIEVLCQEAKDYRFHAVCVNPCYVNLAAEALKESDVKVCSVVGFPLGANTKSQKLSEAEECLFNGAKEIDVVIALGAIKSGNWRYVEEELSALRLLIKEHSILKVIMETGLLKESELVRACIIAKDLELDFVKTSTGFSGEGATVEKVALMKKTVGPRVGVKASGGIRNWPQMQAMLKAGATRIGTSGGVAIMEELKVESIKRQASS